jgi:hypothetical protein
MWKNNGNIDFDFFNAHDICSARDSSLTESIKASLRTRLQNSKVFLLLIGDHTRYLRRFVEWEIKEAIKMKIPIVAANINGSNGIDYLCPPALKNQTAVFVPFKASNINHALHNWPSYLKSHPSASGPFSYNK